MSDDTKKPDDLVFYGPVGPIFEDLPTDSEEQDPMFWDGRLRTEDEMIKIVYEVIRKALPYPVAAGCYLGWGGTYGKFPPSFGHE